MRPRVNILSSGKGLELYVERLYTDMGYTDVHRDVALAKKTASGIVRAQIDLTYTFLGVTRYVECKHYARSVPLEEVSKFSAVLTVFDIPLQCGEMLSTSSFDRRARAYASTHGITLIDGEALRALHEKRVTGIHRLVYALKAYHACTRQGISATLRDIIRAHAPIDVSIAYYEKSYK